jgi:predicted acyl esterase
MGDDWFHFGAFRLSMDIFRGRYRRASAPGAIASNTPLPYRFIPSTATHMFLPGHRIMVQVQSSWFPAEYRKATQRCTTRRTRPAHRAAGGAGEALTAAGRTGVVSRCSGPDVLRPRDDR